MSLVSQACRGDGFGSSRVVARRGISNLGLRICFLRTRARRLSGFPPSLLLLL